MEDRFTGESSFYLYDPSGNVAGITDQDGYLWQSYRYDAFGNATFGSPQYDNEYTFNSESYNPNIHSQYLRARYYDTVKGSFLTEDSYLGDIRNPLTLNRYSYCIGNPLFYSDPSGHESWGKVLFDYAMDSDICGRSIGMWYLYNDGEDYIIDENNAEQGLWKWYMEKNDILTGKVGDVVIPIGNNLEKNESIEIDMSFSMIIQNGEGARGYMFMHGTDASVGGFQIKGTISKDKEGTRTYDLTYTWNDIMNPFPEVYDSDAIKAEAAKKIPFANPQDYNFHLTWSDKTIIHEEESFFKRNKGWLKDWNEEWCDNLSEEDRVMYNWIDYEQVHDLGALKWKEVLERIREEYSAYYGC